MKFITKNLVDTKKLADAFVKNLSDNGLFVTLTGDIGAGKTQFIRFVLENLNVDSKVTSPSFVILNEYKCERFPIYHFDLYRLEEKGLSSVVAELREYSKNGVLTFIEWADFAFNEIPSNSLKIDVQYDESDVDVRIYDFSSKNEKNQEFIENLFKDLNK